MLSSQTAARGRLPKLRLETAIRCAHCQHSNRRDTPFCLRCGFKLVQLQRATGCDTCGTLATDGSSRYCANCGSPDEDALADPGATAPRGIPMMEMGTRLALLDSAGDIKRVIPLDDQRRATLTSDSLGVQVRDSMFGGEGIAVYAADQNCVRVEPIGTPRRLFLFLTQRTTLGDGDMVLVGSQIIRHRVLRRHDSPLCGDALQGDGSNVPSEDVSVLEQLLDGGRVRDIVHLSPARTFTLGRVTGDWLFPYDQTVSARHCEIACDADGVVSVLDVGSRNGTAIAVREAQLLRPGQRMSYDGQMIRLDVV